jgi:hypothetical protein
MRRCFAVEKSSLYVGAEQEALRFKWIESEKAGRDLGEAAIRRWVQNHWWGYLRARWLEHLQGKRFWIELDRGDFGLLQRRFLDDALLLDRIFDRFKAGQENLDIICWAQTWGIPMEPVLRILEAVDSNSRRLVHRFDPPDVPLVTIEPAWLVWDGGTVVRLARVIAAEGAFADLPILGDALEEAGCVDPAILDHCRSAGPHTRWSWLVNLLLWGVPWGAG